MTKWSLNTLANALNVEVSPPTADLKFHTVSIDSRMLARGDLFWAIHGPNFDGHSFVNDAIEAGACAVVVSRQLPGIRVPQFVVGDTKVALARFAKWWRLQLPATIVGVTGSVGKTTTRRMIAAVLSAAGSVTQSPANFNNDIGLPLSLLQASREDEFVVLELGASAIGEIAHLSSIAMPDIGVITAIAPAHLDGFGSIEAIARAKGELIEALDSSSTAILNGDDELVRKTATRTRANVVLIGTDPANDMVATEVSATEAGLSFAVNSQNYQVAAIGSHNITNTLAAIAVGKSCGLKANQVAQGLEAYKPLPGRFFLQHVGHNAVIDDSYNASPRSVKAAITMLSDCISTQRRVAIIGDMLELGELAESLHIEIGEHIAHAGIDHFVAVGQFATAMTTAALAAGMSREQTTNCRDANEVIAALPSLLNSTPATFLVKGSRGLRLERVVERLTVTNPAEELAA